MIIKAVSKGKKYINVLGKNLMRACRRYIELNATLNVFFLNATQKRKLSEVLLHDHQNTFIKLSSVYLVVSLKNLSILRGLCFCTA